MKPSSQASTFARSKGSPPARAAGAAGGAAFAERGVATGAWGAGPWVRAAGPASAASSAAAIIFNDRMIPPCVADVFIARLRPAALPFIYLQWLRVLNGP